MDDELRCFQKLVEGALTELLSSKHLYQSTQVDQKVIDGFVARQVEEAELAAGHPGGKGEYHGSLDELFRKRFRMMAKQQDWAPQVGDSEPGYGEVAFNLPTPVLTFCTTCQEHLPFNPVDAGKVISGDSYGSEAGKPVRQAFVLPYQCQKCRSEPLVFMVKRTGLKLQLCGRSILEAVPSPRTLPKDQAPFFSDARIAHNAGQTLAGLFLLRTFIEQFWLSVPAVAAKREAMLRANQRATGDDLGSAYNERLPADFKDRFPSLPDIYRKLSEAMHEAKPDAALFEGSAMEIEEHFAARRVFKLDQALP